MFTGGLSKMSRAEAQALVEKEGGKILGSVSKKLNYLVIGNSKPTKRKNIAISPSLIQWCKSLSIEKVEILILIELCKSLE